MGASEFIWIWLNWIIYFLWKLSEFEHKCWIRCSAVWKWFSQGSHVWFLGLEIPFLVCMCLVTQFCMTLCGPMGCRPPGSSVHGDSPGKNTGEGTIPFSRYFPCPEIEPRFPASQVDSLWSEAPGKPLAVPSLDTAISITLTVLCLQPSILNWKNKREGGINIYTLLKLHIKQITNENPRYSTRNST